MFSKFTCTLDYKDVKNASEQKPIYAIYSEQKKSQRYFLVKIKVPKLNSYTQKYDGASWSYRKDINHEVLKWTKLHEALEYINENARVIDKNAGYHIKLTTNPPIKEYVIYCKHLKESQTGWLSGQRGFKELTRDIHYGARKFTEKDAKKWVDSHQQYAFKYEFEVQKVEKEEN